MSAHVHDPMLDIATEQDVIAAREQEEKVDLTKSYAQFLWACIAVFAVVIGGMAIRFLFW